MTDLAMTEAAKIASELSPTQIKILTERQSQQLSKVTELPMIGLYKRIDGTSFWTLTPLGLAVRDEVEAKP